MFGYPGDSGHKAQYRGTHTAGPERVFPTVLCVDCGVLQCTVSSYQSPNRLGITIVYVPINDIFHSVV